MPAYRLTIDAAPEAFAPFSMTNGRDCGWRMARSSIGRRAGHENPTTLFQLIDPDVAIESHRLVISGTLSGLRIEHTFTFLRQARDG